MIYGAGPRTVVHIPDLDLQEVMYYLYLPVRMKTRAEANGWDVRMPLAIAHLRGMVLAAEEAAKSLYKREYQYTYISARKGWATPDNPLNRPGWHADGFGTDDLNFVWWKGDGTRFAVQEFNNISEDHTESLKQFTEQIKPECVITPDAGILYMIDPSVVHATPIIKVPGWRQYVKISLSDHKYNLENNSHNYAFDYEWPMHGREAARNDPHKAGRDYA